LRTADSFLSQIQPGINVDAIAQRRSQLAERLRSIADPDDSAEAV
jgi:hypothetical protein